MTYHQLQALSHLPSLC